MKTLTVIGLLLIMPVISLAQDTTPPDGVVIINNNPLNTNSRTVKIYVLSGDAGSGVDEMCVSVGTSCNTWQPYNKEATVILSGAVGNWYSICSKVRDKAGNESAQSCAQIQLTGE